MKVTYSPIGIFKCKKQSPVEAANQGNRDQSRELGLIQLNSGSNFQQALIGLKSFSHIWIIFDFHHNSNWKPMTLPPRGLNKKIGVFATRSPYRPNSIGISLVKLKKVEGLNLYIEKYDLLDGTPILDIKPYLIDADIENKANAGWLAKIESKRNLVGFSSLAAKQLLWLRKNGLSEIKNVIINQLSFDPINKRKKRVRKIDNQYQLSYKTWRIAFTFKKTVKKITVLHISSGYSKTEILDPLDTYADKPLHLKFLKLSGK